MKFFNQSFLFCIFNVEKPLPASKSTPFYRWVFRKTLLAVERGGNRKVWEKQVNKIQDLLLKPMCKDFDFQVEQTCVDERLNTHIQGYLELEKRLRNHQFLNLLRNHEITKNIWIEPARNKAQAKEYATKTDTRLFGPFSKKNPFDSKANALIPTEWLTWTLPIVQHIDQFSPDGRGAYWIYDLIGGRGTYSFFCFNFFLFPFRLPL